MISIFFSLGLFLSASLLFIIQPMVAKSLLPVYGGTPAVWIVCMLFFQALLLVAYAYVWLLSLAKSKWAWRLVHAVLILLSLLFLPQDFVVITSTRSPDLAILSDLLYQFGLPLLVLASSAPLLQFIYSRTNAQSAKDPYFLYTASNTGSLLALLLYPWLIERFSGLHFQFYYWNWGFIAYLILVAGILFFVPANNQIKDKAANSTISKSMVLWWIFLSFIPCSLMLGVTFYITTDIAASPLFWVIPLSLYLLTFIISFAKKPIIPHAWVCQSALYFIFFPLLGFIIGPGLLSTWQLIGFHLLGFFMLSLLCHGELVRVRPDSNQLTTFYLCIAFGGVLAGLFNGLLAVRLFNGAYEYPLILVLATFAIPLSSSQRIKWLMPALILTLLLANYYMPDYAWLSWVKNTTNIGILALMLMLIMPKNKLNVFASFTIIIVFIFSPWFKEAPILNQQRNFYGVKQVLLKNGTHALISQNTLHGFQLLDKTNSTKGSIGYYGPMAAVVSFLEESHLSLRASILGLGTGLMACQFQKEDKLEMIDIDEQVIAIAKDNSLFTYLRDCPPKVSLVLGDGRSALHATPNGYLDLLVVDAFSSDAIPTHLLTKEAFVLYKEKLDSEGVILLHTSNRHINLWPVIAAVGQYLDFIVLHKEHMGDAKAGQFPSEWILLTTNEALVMTLLAKEQWRFVSLQTTAMWTDDYSNLISLLK